MINVNASSDGELLLKKNNPAEIKECWEGFNRASFTLNQGLDKILFKPVGKCLQSFTNTNQKWCE
jgi:phospholipid-binding lipoprotein MlaA